MSGVVHSRAENEIAVITVDQPPVNALSTAVRRGLSAAIKTIWLYVESCITRRQHARTNQP